MAPLLLRDYCSGSANCLSPESPWYTYGRWILLAIIVALALLIFVVFAIFAQRRRKRLGDNPLPMMAWAHRPDKRQWEDGYVRDDGAGRGQESGVTLQEPEAVHTHGGLGSKGEFAPPAGPPPGKH